MSHVSGQFNLFTSTLVVTTYQWVLLDLFIKSQVIYKNIMTVNMN